MPIQKLTIEDFLQLSQSYPVLDVRSPGEYDHAHIPGAYNLPLFSDEERKVVGTAYKQESREAAIKKGLDYFGIKMRSMVEEAEGIMAKRPKINTANQTPTVDPCILVHCWRGGMRSAGVAWLLDLYGFKVYTLTGGYKAYRRWVLAQFEKNYNFKIIGGYTGSGKTLVLQELKKEHKITINLEMLANHKGSAFGSMGPQPSQEMFENLLAGQLAGANINLSGKGTGSRDQNACIYIEDESQRIGNLQIPMPLWNTIRKSTVAFLDIPFEERLNYITAAYGTLEKESLVNAVMRIQKRLGGLETKNAINFLLAGDLRESFRILLTYYDKWYSKALHNRENLTALLNKIPCMGVDTKTNTQKLLSCDTVTS